jgi:hypothetical protein
LFPSVLVLARDLVIMTLTAYPSHKDSIFKFFKTANGVSPSSNLKSKKTFVLFIPITFIQNHHFFDLMV